MSRAPAAIVAAILASLALAACDGSGQSSVTVSTPSPTTTTTTPPPPPKETRDALPDRPQDWVRFVNERGGYASLIDYGTPPPPPGLSPEEARWAEGLRNRRASV